MIKQTISKVVSRNDLDEEEMQAVMESVLAGGT